MQKFFTSRDKKLLKGLKIKYFQFFYDDEDSRFEDNDENDIRDDKVLLIAKGLID